MSVSSAATLISPSTTIRSQPGQAGQPPRRTTTHTSQASHSTHTAHSHHAHAAGGHHAKRKASTGAHAHVAPHGSGKGTTSRRSSEGENGRRAMVAGLQMNTLDPEKPKRKGSGDRPLPKASRSDTHLPSLSRQASNSSTASHTSHSSQPRRPKPQHRKKSGESVELDEEGHETGQVDSAEEGWESGEEDGKGRSRGSGKGKGKGREQDPMSDALRRTVSDPIAESARAQDGPLVESPNKVDELPDPAPSHLPPQTRKMTGFAGPMQPPDPGVATPSHAPNDPTHIGPVHQIKRQQSLRAMHGAHAPETDGSATGHRQASDLSPSSQLRTPSASNAPPLPVPLSNAQGEITDTHPDGAKTYNPSTSPHFPFPKIEVAAGTALPTPPHSAELQQPRSRQVSSKSGMLRHRLSNSSLRSLQSFRAPPHPLNSPTGYKTGIASVSTTMTSPMKGKRGPSMHHPPMAPPVVYREIATGHGWIDEEPDHSPSSSTVSQQRTNGTENSSSSMLRRTSHSSMRSLQGLLASQRMDGSTPNGPRPPPMPPTPRRKTALEVASAASKLQTTTDPTLYHSSLGLPSSSAETAHLISRFLPPKRVRRPAWEVSSTVTPEGELRVGLTNGDYREAHESLVRTMKHLAAGGPSGGGRRTMSNRTASFGYSSVLGGLAGRAEESVGVLDGKYGTMMVKRGDWGGKSPFELSVDRCLAQRPQRSFPGL